ncbi:CGNR zinc finger domain-containing protein [Nocardia cyriacigeorgica]|uniref:CGNR zinc finger domain-containing protein n=1 Tax=Nocardia cyriacigeorgica TaxID=135487 RepID=UPI00245599E0|nr:CGNR zinc finger domain-containing protein [Nocardia cyriacigeorgica]
MQSRADLPPDLRRRFRTGRPALDLVHTGGAGDLSAWEIVHNIEDLRRWLTVILEVDVISAEPADLPRMRALRAAITRAAFDAAAGAPLRAEEVAAVNAVAEGPSLIPVLHADGTRGYRDPTAAAALSTLARDAIDLFSGPLAGRIRVCAAEDCGLLFVDASRPGRRRWCSMDRCGNLAKVRRYRGSDPVDDGER